MTADPPKTRPLERFWPYAELPEAPSDDELASLDPALKDALFGPSTHRFSVTLVFPELDVDDFPRALALAREAAEFRTIGQGDLLRHRARFWSSDVSRLRDLYRIVGGSAETEVLIDDRPVPYTRELWLPLLWLLIPG